VEWGSAYPVAETRLRAERLPADCRQHAFNDRLCTWRPANTVPSSRLEGSPSGRWRRS
jgi:hypothetical protein